MWDAIVIGAGIGGLSAAAALARHGRRVLVLEQRGQPGGRSTTFRRQNWEFATGIHPVCGVGPQAGPGGLAGRLLDWLGDGSLQFTPSHQPHDTVQLGEDWRFGIAHPEAAYREALLTAFPDDSRAIHQWFSTAQAAQAAANQLLLARNLSPTWGSVLRLLTGMQMTQWLGVTLSDELARVSNPRLRAVLGARWGYYGAPPAVAPFVEHARVTGACDAGSDVPVGGPSRMAASLIPAIVAAGGDCRLHHHVRRILDEDGRASGVEVEVDGERITARARHIISDIGLTRTLGCLPAAQWPRWRALAGMLEPGPGYVKLYLGLDGDLAAAGVTGANHWIYPDEDIGRLWAPAADQEAPNLLVNFPSRKDPQAATAPTAEILALVDPSVFRPWLGASRDDGTYEAFESAVTGRLLAQFQRLFPAVAPRVRHVETVTPVTPRQVAASAQGSPPGLAMNAVRLASPALRIRTPLPGLLLAGEDVAGPGSQPALLSGVMAAAHVERGIWRAFTR